MRILNFGSMNIEYVYRVKSIVKPGETISSADVSTYCGGKGLNQSIALSKAGAVVYHSGLVGKDSNILANMLKSNGIDTSLIGIEEGRSGHTMIQVDDDGQNSIVLYGGTNKLINEGFIDSILEKMPQPRCLYCFW
jgi:ribokinase